MVIFIVLAIVFFIIAYNTDQDIFLYGTFWSAVIAIILLIAICFIIANVSTEHVLDNKITMYEEENAKIEKRVDDTVNNYLNYEKEVIKELKPSGNSMALATIIPELNSNTLVQQQITLYNENKEKITELKEDKIELETLRWLLYFGK